MSILDDNGPVVPQIPKAKMAAKRLVQMTKQTYQQMVQAFNEGARTFWANGMEVSPADIAAELGTDAKEVFELHSKLGQLLATVKPASIAEGTSLVGNFTMNEDGTVTIIESIPETPTPE